MTLHLGFVVFAALAAAAPTAPAAPSSQPALPASKPGFVRAWEPYWPFSVEVPKAWAMAKSGFQGPHGDAVEDHPLQASIPAGKGDAVLGIAIYYNGHPEFKDINAFVDAQSKAEGAVATAPTEVSIPKMKPGKRFEVTEKAKGQRSAYAVIPAFDGFWMFTYSAPTSAYAKHLPAFNHLIASFKFTTPRAK